MLHKSLDSSSPHGAVLVLNHTHTHKNESFLVSEKHKTSLPVTSVLLGLHTHGRGARSLCCLRLRQRRAFAISQLEKYSSR